MGGVRTALYNYLFARHHGGTFVLRIEDTDRTRFVEGAEDYIIEALKWCGIEPDEGVGYGGEFGPYRQSDRMDMYIRFVDQLVANGHAYYAFDTPEEIDEKRKAAEAQKEVWQYDASTRSEMKNSLSLPSEEVERHLVTGSPVTVRFKMPADEEVVFEDAVRGTVRISTKVLDDKVLLKSDKMPTYHLANVVDDHLMQISHVIRGEEWLSSTPLHMLLYRAFGWDAPTFAHLPLILKPTGKGKLSKRDGEAGGFPVFPLEWKDPKTGTVASGYRESGYYPEAFINMLLMLGWNPGTEQERFTDDEMVKSFSLDRVVKSGARFNPEKARWFNEQVLRDQSEADLAAQLKPIAEAKGITLSDAQLLAVAGMMKERSAFLYELLAADYLFNAPESYHEKTVKKKWKEQTPEIMQQLIAVLEGIDPFDEATIETEFKAFLEKNELGFGAVLPNFRLLVTGEGGGPSMFAIAAFIGKEETLRRMRSGLEKLSA
jgi:glutamyl-tRNA synthetase